MTTAPPPSLGRACTPPARDAAHPPRHTALRNLPHALWSAALLVLALAGCEGSPIVQPSASDARVTADATEVGLSCPTPLLACGGQCANPSIDARNCGACGQSCGRGEVCQNAVCVPQCTSSETLCAGGGDAGAGARCVSLTTDRQNCGACGNACGASQVCSGGVCTFMCSGASTECTSAAGSMDGGTDHYCAELMTDRANCGACGNACPDGSVCESGACHIRCDAPQSHCPAPAGGGEVCVDLTSDPTQCGTCGNACSFGQFCVHGTCQTSCASGFTHCMGYCRDLARDSLGCGACGTMCGSGEVCSGGHCVVTCGAGLTVCDGTCRDLQSDVANCGACGRSCATGQMCVGGACVCPTGQRLVGTTCVAGAPRPITPMSAGDVTQRRPTLRWALPTGFDGAVVELCSDRACTTVIETLTVSGTSAQPTVDLPAHSVVFWRIRGRVGTATDTVYSPTWLFHVPAASARTVTDTSYHPHFDVNGDGFDDIVVGAYAESSFTGRVYVYLGSASGVSSTAATTLTGPGGSGGYFGYSVSSAGDVNGDGFSDLIVGARAESSFTGRAYVYLGSASGISTTVATTLTGPGGTSGFFGYSVSSAGDVNGDGFSDLIVGAYGVSSSTGRGYVYLGSASGISTTVATTLTGPGGPSGSFGCSVSSAGDLNGDGFSDLIVGAIGESSQTGRAYVYLGSASGISTTAAATLTGPGGPGGSFGCSVSSAGDVNGDGFSDLIVGAYAELSYTGRAYVYLGSASGISTTVATTLTGPGGANGVFGNSVSSAGDVNGDGFSDLIVGAYGEPSSSSTGRAYVYLGSASGVSSTAATTLTGPGGTSGRFGYSVSSAGDVNGDGFSDLIVGAYGVSSFTGRAYVYLGSASGISTTVATTLTGPGGANGAFGSSVSSAGDVLRDGLWDDALSDRTRDRLSSPHARERPTMHARSHVAPRRRALA